MYELRLKKRKELIEKKWFNFALILLAIFLFSQGSALLKTSMGYAIPVIIISFLMHSRSIEKICLKLFKIEASIIANIAMLTTLSIISIICYFIPLKSIVIALLDLVSIIIYFITAFICFKFNKGEQ